MRPHQASNAAVEADTGWIFLSTRLLLSIQKMRVIVAQEVKKHDVISMQSVVAEIDGDHLADDGTEFTPTNLEVSVQNKSVRKKAKGQRKTTWTRGPLRRVRDRPVWFAG